MRINGKELSDNILTDLKKQTEKLHLAIILVGNDPSSISYIRQKETKAEIIGIQTTVYRFEESASQKRIITLIKKLNASPGINGIIVQQPLPRKIDKNAVISAISAEKDIDGFRKDSKYDSPIVLAVDKILEYIFSSNKNMGKKDNHKYINWLAEKYILIIGKGSTGGKPIMDYFNKLHIKIHVMDTDTINKEKLFKRADIIISAVGKKSIIKPNMIKRGVILIGIGLHKARNGKLHGDFEEDKIKKIASFYTPTPGGVGPMNVAMLLKNLVQGAGKNKLLLTINK